MNEKRLRAREEKEIDLIDLLIEIMLHWRGLIVAFLIGGILLGGYSFMQSYKVRESAKEAADEAAKKAAEAEAVIFSDEEKLANLTEQAETLEKNLTAASISNVETALSNFVQANSIRNYLDSSVLMKTDPYNIPSGDVIYSIFADEENKENIRVAYEGIFSSAELFNHVKEKTGYGSEVYELIKVNDKESGLLQSSSKVQLQEDNSGVIRVHCYAGTEEICGKMTEAIIEYANSLSSSLQSKLGYHELRMISSSVTVGYRPDIAQTRADKEKQLYTSEAAITKAADTFTVQEKEYFSLRKNIEILNGQINEQIAENTANEVMIPGLAVSKKKVLIGVVLGVFLYAGIICVAYIFSQKIKDSDDFTVTFGTAQLGKLYGQRSFKGFGKKLDKWFYSFKNRGRKAIAADEATGIIATNAALSAAKSDIKKLGIICAGGVEENAGGLVEKLNAAMKAENIDAKVLSQLLYSKDEAYSMKDIDAVVLVAAAGKSRYSEVWDAMEVIDNQKIDILGGIMA